MFTSGRYIALGCLISAAAYGGYLYGKTKARPLLPPGQFWLFSPRGNLKASLPFVLPGKAPIAGAVSSPMTTPPAAAPDSAQAKEWEKLLKAAPLELLNKISGERYNEWWESNLGVRFPVSYDDKDIKAQQDDLWPGMKSTFHERAYQKAELRFTVDGAEQHFLLLLQQGQRALKDGDYTIIPAQDVTRPDKLECNVYITRLPISRSASGYSINSGYGNCMPGYLSKVGARYFVRLNLWSTDPPIPVESIAVEPPAGARAGASELWYFVKKTGRWEQAPGPDWETISQAEYDNYSKAEPTD